MGSWVLGLFCFRVGWGFGGCFVLFCQKKVWAVQFAESQLSPTGMTRLGLMNADAYAHGALGFPRYASLRMLPILDFSFSDALGFSLSPSFSFPA
jgi:hypothetical protein